MGHWEKFLYLFLFLTLATQSYSDEKGNEFNVRVNGGYVYSSIGGSSSADESAKVGAHGGYGSISFDYFKFHFNNVTFSPFKLSVGYHYLNSSAHKNGSTTAGAVLGASEDAYQSEEEDSSVDPMAISSSLSAPIQTYSNIKIEHLITVTIDPTVSLLKDFAWEGSSIDLYGKIGVGIFTVKNSKLYVGDRDISSNTNNRTYTSLIGGAGINLNFNKHVGLNVEYLGMPSTKLAGAENNSVLLHLIKAGVTVNF